MLAVSLKRSLQQRGSLQTAADRLVVAHFGDRGAPLGRVLLGAPLARSAHAAGGREYQLARGVEIVIILEERLN